MGSFLSALYNPGQFFGTNSGIGSAINSITGASESAYKQYKYQKKLQKQAQEFAKWQMGNSHQMEVQDLQNAGLNPVLSAGGSGADAGGVSMGSASTGTPAADPISMVGSIIGMMNSSKQTNALVDKTEAEVNNINADTKNKGQQYDLQPGMVQSIIDLNNANTSKTRAERSKILAEKMAVQFNNKMKEMDIDKRTQEWDNEVNIYKHQMKIALIEAGVDDSTAGMILRQFGKSMNAFSPFTSFIPSGGNTYNFNTNSPTVNY